MTGPVLFWTILLSVVKLVVTCLPTDAVNWILGKFKVHPELSDENTVITMDEKELEEEEKRQVIQDMNQAIFLKKNHIFPGNEQLFLHPEDSMTPLVIDTNHNKKDVRLLLFVYPDRIQVVKQRKKKLVAYSLLSESLQGRFIPKAI